MASIAAASHLDEPSVKIDGEPVPVARSEAQQETAEASVTLEALEAALPGGEEPAESGRKPRRRSRSRSRARSQEQEQGAGASESAEPAEAAAAVQEPVQEEAASVQEAVARKPRKRSRSASAPQSAPAGNDQPVLTGLALPASEAPAAEPAAEAEPAAQQPAAAAAVEKNSTKPKRRSRRATSVQGDATAEVLVAEVSAATGSVVQMDSSSAQAAKPAEPAGAPVMFGVGVPVRELK